MVFPEKLVCGLILTRGEIFEGIDGNLLKILDNRCDGFSEFGEVYISTIKKNRIKGWKKHKQMVVNLVVPCGEVKLVVFDDREASKTKGTFNEFTLSVKNYLRVTIPPMLFFAFQGIDERNFLLNVASIPHDDNECENYELNHINYDWKV
jgi:dTDP-4-dehydrorhamnose 3,5-epimerase